MAERTGSETYPYPPLTNKGFRSLPSCGYLAATMDRATRKLRLVVHALAIHLDDPDRGRLGVARILTSFSAWCFAIALGVYGFEAHGVVGVGLVALIRYLPGALAAPIAGVMIDRHSRRTVLVGSAALMFLIGSRMVTPFRTRHWATISLGSGSG